MQNGGSSELFNDMNRLKNEISNLKNEINKAHKLKEEWFRKKQNLEKQISYEIEVVKTLKKQLDSKNIKITDSKKERDLHNQRVKDVASKLKELHKQKKEIIERLGIKENPSYIKERIEKLEMLIQTEVFSIEKEREIMKEIKKLKLVYEEVKILEKINEEINKLVKHLDSEKKEADLFHNLLKENIPSNNEQYNKFIELVKKINSLRKLKKEALTNFKNFKKSFVSLNSLLKQKILGLAEIKLKIDKIKKEKQEIEKKNRENIIEKKQEDAVKKLKSSGRLTTEDLINFQGS